MIVKNGRYYIDISRAFLVLAAPWSPGQGWITVVTAEPNNLATLVGLRQCSRLSGSFVRCHGVKWSPGGDLPTARHWVRHVFGGGNVWVVVRAPPSFAVSNSVGESVAGLTPCTDEWNADTEIAGGATATARNRGHAARDRWVGYEHQAAEVETRFERWFSW